VVTDAFKRLDQFRTVTKDLTNAKIYGGIYTAIAYAVVVLLFVAELGAFLRPTYSTTVLMDSNSHRLISMRLGIVLYDLPCKYVKVGVWDQFQDEELNTTGVFWFQTIDHKGEGSEPKYYTVDDIASLEKVDSLTDVDAEEKKELDSDWTSTDDHFKHHDLHKALTFHDFTFVNFYAGWCHHCRKFAPTWTQASKQISEKMQFTDGDGKQITVKMMKINCVDFAEHCQTARIAAFPSVRLYKRDGSFEAFSQKRTVEEIIGFLTSKIKESHNIVAQHHAIFAEGCYVTGVLEVPRVPGRFHLQAAGSGDVNVNPAFTNVSHLVDEFNFGTRIGATPWAMSQHNPLSGKSFIVERFHQAPQHHLKVASTFLHGNPNDVFYQMTHSDRIRKFNKSEAPQALFSYDFSPMSVVVKVRSKRWYEFLTSLFALLGGTYTIVELCSGAVDTVSTALKEALGKTN